MLISPNLKLLMDANLGVVTVWRIQAESLHCPLAPPASSLSNELWRACGGRTGPSEPSWNRSDVFSVNMTVDWT